MSLSRSVSRGVGPPLCRATARLTPLHLMAVDGGVHEAIVAVRRKEGAQRLDHALAGSLEQARQVLDLGSGAVGPGDARPARIDADDTEALLHDHRRRVGHDPGLHQVVLEPTAQLPAPPPGRDALDEGDGSDHAAALDRFPVGHRSELAKWCLVPHESVRFSTPGASEGTQGRPR